MSLFDKIGDVKLAQGGNYLDIPATGGTGRYRLEVVKIGLYDGRKEKFQAADFKVIGSNVEKHKPGSTVNYYNGATKDGFLQNAKGLALAALSSYAGTKVEDVNTEEMDALHAAWTDEEGKERPAGTMCAGAIIEAETFKKKNKTTGGEYTVVRWYPVLPASE